MVSLKSAEFSRVGKLELNTQLKSGPWAFKNGDWGNTTKGRFSSDEPAPAVKVFAFPFK